MHYLLISETKLKEDFPNAQFLVPDNKIKNRKDGSKHGVELLEFVKKNFIWKQVKLFRLN